MKKNKKICGLQNNPNVTKRFTDLSPALQVKQCPKCNRVMIQLNSYYQCWNEYCGFQCEIERE